MPVPMFTPSSSTPADPTSAVALHINPTRLHQLPRGTYFTLEHLADTVEDTHADAGGAVGSVGDGKNMAIPTVSPVYIACGECVDGERTCCNPQLGTLHNLRASCVVYPLGAVVVSITQRF